MKAKNNKEKGGTIAQNVDNQKEIEKLKAQLVQAFRACLEKEETTKIAKAQVAAANKALNIANERANNYHALNVELSKSLGVTS